jgi:hypothetical protein
LGNRLGSLIFGFITAAAALVMVPAPVGANDRLQARAELAPQPSPHAARAMPGMQGASVDAARYFIEFRSRTGFYGHTYVVYGQLDGRGKRTDVRYAGLYPEGGPFGVMLGHVLPVPATVGAVEDDLIDPVTEAYLRIVSAAEFAKVTAAIGRLRANTQLWNALLNNCNDFAAELAQELGLRTPSTLLIPELFVAELRQMNGS